MKTKKSKMMLKSAMTLILAVFVTSVSFAQTGTQTKPQTATPPKTQTVAQSKPQTGQKPSREEYVKMMNDRLTAMDKKLITLKAEAVAKKKDTAPEYQTLLGTAEGKISALKNRVGSFKETAPDKVDAFERDANTSYKSIEQDYSKLHAQVYGEMKAAPAKTPTPQKAAPKN